MWNQKQVWGALEPVSPGETRHPLLPVGGDAEAQLLPPEAEQRAPGSSLVGIPESGCPAPAKAGAHGRQDPCGSNTHAHEGDRGEPRRYNLKYQQPQLRAYIVGTAVSSLCVRCEPQSPCHRQEDNYSDDAEVSEAQGGEATCPRRHSEGAVVGFGRQS